MPMLPPMCFQAVCKASVSFMRATFIVSRVQLVMQLYPNVLLAPILAATVAACGGECKRD